MNKEKLAWVIAVVAIVAALGLWFTRSNGVSVGAPGGLLIENYIPAILYNDGYKSAKGIDTTSTLDVDGAATLGAGTFSSTLGVTGAATLSSTLAVTATTTLSDTVKFDNGGICIDFYATSTATRAHMTASTTATIEGVDGVMMWEYGACAL